MQLHIIENKIYIDISEGRKKYHENKTILKFAKKKDKEFCKLVELSHIIANKDKKYKRYEKNYEQTQIYVLQQDFVEFIQKASILINKTKQLKSTPQKKIEYMTLEQAKKSFSFSSIISGLYVIIIKSENDSVVCKFGRSKNLQDRLNKHINIYTNAYFFYVSQIDKCFNSKAEIELSDFFKTIGEIIPIINGNKCKEVFKIKEIELNRIQKKMDELSVTFSKNSDNLSDIIIKKDDMIREKDAKIYMETFKKELAISHLESINESIKDKIAILKN